MSRMSEGVHYLINIFFNALFIHKIIIMMRDLAVSVDILLNNVYYEYMLVFFCIAWYKSGSSKYKSLQNIEIKIYVVNIFSQKYIFKKIDIPIL